MTRVWVGIAGTDNFRSVDPASDSAGAPFELRDVHAAARRLPVYVKPQVQVDEIGRPVPADTVGYSPSASGRRE